MARNWMEETEKWNDEKFEKQIRERLEYLLDKLALTTDDFKRLNILEGIIEEYEDLRRNVFEYDKDDYEKKKKEYNDLMDKIKYEEHNSSKESQSWNDYRNGRM